MNVYDFLTQTYSTFIGMFPGQIQWLITLLILLGLIGAIYSLVRHNVLFLIVVIVLLPFLIPVLASFFHDVYAFVLYLAGVLRLTAPKTA